jgi:uncharacterized protein YndB with AHSA1/START domain
LAPLVKTVVVGCSPEHAFEVFTRDINLWWPVEGHSLGEEKVDLVVFEQQDGGRVLERWHDGTECVWGVVSTWEPPRRVTFSWHPNPEAKDRTDIEVTFEPSADGTVVTLEHRGWDADYENVEERRHNYDSGWEGTLKLYAERADAA